MIHGICRWNRVLFAAIFFAICLSEHKRLQADERDLFLAAASAVDITPPVGYRHGGGYSEVISSGIRDPLYAKAIVFRQGEYAFVIVECDLLSIPASISAMVRKQVEQTTGIPGPQVVIAATHNHGSPEYWGPLRDLFHEREMQVSGSDKNETINYPELLVERIVEAVQLAVQRCEPMTVELLVAQTKGLAFNRRFHMLDGSVEFNPGKMNPAIVRSAGPVDEELPFLLFRSSADQKASFMMIKASSPFRNTVVVSLANDVDYYIPTRRAFEEGSYEVTTCPLTPGCGESLVALAIELLHELKLDLSP